MTQQPPTAPSRGERILAYMFIAMVALTVLSIVLLLCSAFLGNSGNFDEGLWPVIAVTPLIALPFAFIMAVALSIVVTRRRRRDAAGRPTDAKNAMPRRDATAARPTNPSAQSKTSARAKSPETKTAAQARPPRPTKSK